MITETLKTIQKENLKEKLLHVAFFSDNIDPKSSDVIAGKKELFRCVVTSAVIVNDLILLDYVIAENQYCPFSTITAASSDKSFTLLSISGFTVGDRIKIPISGSPQDRGIASIVGNVITVDESLGVIPSIGLKITVKPTARAVIYNGQGGANTGIIGFIFKYDNIKDQGYQRKGQAKIELKGA